MSDRSRKPSIPELVAEFQGERIDDSLKSMHGVAVESAGHAFPKTPEETFEWLKQALQAAVNLEFATIPPYLCALWSIKDELHPVAKSIREVVQEEMLHMALTCNMLAAIGEEPIICDSAPVYPGPLPGNVHRGLIVELSGLNDHALEIFLTIERPSKFPENVEADDEDTSPAERTIGEFYNCILTAFDSALQRSRPTARSPVRSRGWLSPT